VLSVPGESGDHEEEGPLRFMVYVGLFDMLTDAVADGHSEPGERRDVLERLYRTVQAAEGPLRFALFDEGGRAEQRELISRMRGKDIAMTREWMIPRLHRDIAAYRARIEALRAALESSS